MTKLKKLHEALMKYIFGYVSRYVAVVLGLSGLDGINLQANTRYKLVLGLCTALICIATLASRYDPVWAAQDEASQAELNTNTENEEAGDADDMDVVDGDLNAKDYTQNVENFSPAKVDLEKWKRLNKRDGKEERKIYKRLVAQQSAELVRGLTTDREKAIALAKWIAGNWRNPSKDPVVHASHNSSSYLAKFLNRTGACGTRTGIYISLAKAVGLKVKPYSIYNFGKVGSGHTAAQVFWDGKWHYMDVTYSGYFEKDGDILSFDEVVSLGASATDYLVPFESFGDVYGRNHPISKWRLVDNSERMKRVYAPEMLASANSRGFVGDAAPVTLKFAMKPGDSLGTVDGNGKDVFKQERKHNKSEQLERMGFTSVPFFQEIHLQKLQPGQTYRYQIDFFGSKLKKGDLFEANSKNCTLKAGQKFDGVGSWVIEVQVNSDHCTLDITHNILDPNRFLEVDMLQFGELM